MRDGASQSVMPRAEIAADGKNRLEEISTDQEPVSPDRTTGGAEACSSLRPSAAPRSLGEAAGVVEIVMPRWSALGHGAPTFHTEFPDLIDRMRLFDLA